MSNDSKISPLGRYLYILVIVFEGFHRIDAAMQWVKVPRYLLLYVMIRSQNMLTWEYALWE